MSGEPSAGPSPDTAEPWSLGMKSVVWQALGSAATLASAAWVSWRFGLAAQGEFGLAKSWFDAAAVIAAGGLPQGLLHLQYRMAVPSADILAGLARGAAALVATSLTLALVMAAFQRPLVAMVLVSVPFAVGHLCARAVLLARRGSVVFGAVTALPSLLVMAGVVLLGLLQAAPDFPLVLLGAAILAGSATMVLAWRSAGARGCAPLPRSELWRVSLQSWMQAALGALLAAGVLSAVAWSGHGGAALGAASLGLLLYQVFAVGAGYIAPLMFDRLAREQQPSLQPWPASARWAGAATLLLALAGVVASGSQAAASAWLLPIALMLPAGAAAVAARVSGTVLLARGDYVELSWQAAWRLVLAVLITLLALHWVPAPAAVALALLLVEVVTWWRCTLRARARGP